MNAGNNFEGEQKMINWKATQMEDNTKEAGMSEQRQRATEINCPQCQTHVQMATPEQAARLTGIPSRVINIWLEESHIHSLKTAEGGLLICLKSLCEIYADSLRKTKEVPAFDRALLPLAVAKA